MSPLDYIKEGILKGNWETVCEGYERLTGEALLHPEDSSSSQARIALDKIREIIDTSNIEERVPSGKKKAGLSKGTRKKKKTKMRDDDEDTSICLDENKITSTQRETGSTQLITNKPDRQEVEANKKKAIRSKANKAQINRQVARTYDVKCNECEQTFKSDRPKGEMGQKCSGCLNDKKSRFTGG